MKGDKRISPKICREEHAGLDDPGDDSQEAKAKDKNHLDGFGIEDHGRVDNPNREAE